jgi:uncharacterized protein YndB with AHSA1/START domain
MHICRHETTLRYGVASIMLKYLIIALGLIALVGGAAFVWGMMLPATVSASRDAEIAASVERVFALVTDPAGQSNWRRDVASVTVKPGARAWTETTRQGVVLRFEEVERLSPQRYAIRFASPQGFSGEWVGTFEARGDVTRVVFTETVTTPGAFGRILARLIAPAGAHIDLYLTDLKAALEKA